MSKLIRSLTNLKKITFMASKEKIEELRQLIDRVPVLRVYIDQTPDLSWTLKSDLPAEEINERIRSEKLPPRLYKEVPCSGLGNDLSIVVTDEDFADEFIEFIINAENNGNN